MLLNDVTKMNISGIWNNFLINATALYLQPNSIIDPVQLIPPYINSSDTNSSSSLSSENTFPLQENECEAEDDNENNDYEYEGANDLNEDDKICNKKQHQRVRYCKEEYKCTKCPYTCTTEKAFLRHLRSCEMEIAPSENQKFSCPICGKDRKNEDILAVHMQKHKQDKNFCCDICKFKTLQLKKLIQHRRMHTGEKPHLCPFCTYRSSRRDNLRSHVRRVHKKDDLPCDTFTPRSMVLSARKSK